MSAVTRDQDITKYIHGLAQQHGVKYRPTPSDLLGHEITRLAGDSVELDETQLLLLGLRRAGYLTSLQAIELLGEYLDRAAR